MSADNDADEVKLAEFEEQISNFHRMKMKNPGSGGRANRKDAKTSNPCFGGRKLDFCDPTFS